jgi:high affinity Mn2+ porin
MPPRNPNEQSIDFRFFKYYGDVFELEHDHKWADQPGAVRLLVYRNYESMGKFSDAISAFQADSADFNAANCGSNYNYGSQNANAPDLCFVRSPHVRMGVGLNMEQNLTADTGVFLRAMWSDGDTEVDAYDAADSAANVGAIIGGAPWGRPLDSIGIGAGASWASRSHAQYLALGGVDGFIGDGALNWAAEKMGEIYYRLHLWKTVALSAEYQKIISPGFNADRGPVNLFGGKFHVEF